MRLWFFSLALLVPTLAVANPDVVTRLLHQEATPGHFEFCHGGGCAGIQQVGLSDGEWGQVSALFVPAPKNAMQERARIARAVALLEQLVGKKTGTSNDLGGTFEGFGLQGQLDCIDESTNTTTYLRMLHKKGVLHFHDITDTHTRGYFLHGWPHTAAGIRENGAQGAVYVVDSWFYANGSPPVIMPLPTWQEGWTPKSPPLPADAKVEPPED